MRRHTPVGAALIVATLVLFTAGCNPSRPQGTPWSAGDASSPERTWSDAGPKHPDAAGPDAAIYAAGAVCDPAKLTASDFGATFMRERCANCHAMVLTGAARSGAPEGLNFDTSADVESHLTAIRLRVIVQRTMPPGAPVPDCIANALTQYLDQFGACSPSCSGRSCGPDGCGGSCGSCGAGEHCDDSSGDCIVPVCEPACQGAACGPDGCGGDCGMCSSGLTCSSARACECAPSCDQRSCGPDGCGGSCGACPDGSVCRLDGSCVCLPNCAGKLCGSDGCGGSCGTCRTGSSCNTAGTACECIPNCQGRNCGSDGCGGSCGGCANALTCNTRTGQCVRNCRSDCTGRACGDDGCGGSCGSACSDGKECTSLGQCQCVPSCLGRACGDDGCGGSCGSCAAGTACNGSGQCGCTADCSGRSCGDDGCGGSCGECAAPTVCSAGQCVTQCVPDCAARSCGSDGCGGTCGSCATGQTCSQGRCAYPNKSFAADVFPIFMATSCGKAACHAGSQPAEELDLSSASVAFAQLVNRAASQCSARLLVASGNPGSSYLVNKLTGTDMCSGSRMPKGGSALSAAQLDTIRSWIGSGAAP